MNLLLLMYFLLTLSEAEVCPQNQKMSLLQDDRYLVDITGHQIDWYNSEDGWTEQSRHNIILANKAMFEQNENLPAYTKYGYQKLDMPKKLHQLILKSFNHTSSKLIDESFIPHTATNNWQRVTNTGKIEHKRNIKTHSMLPRIQRKMDHGIVSTIKPLLESWAGIKLSHEGMPQPGGRRYLRGANMLMHVDAKSHLIGAILQIEQKVEKDWPLTVVDHEGQKKMIYLKPGEMLFYESAKVPHGRQFPLEGEFYDIKLVHFYLDEKLDEKA